MVTDDMPFLVDSVSAEVVRQGRSIRVLFHPQMAARRSEDGTLMSARPQGAETGDHLADGPPHAEPRQVDLLESWMTIVLDPAPALQGRSLVGPLTSVMRDVGLAVRDWPAMRKTMLEVADDVDRAGAHSAAGADDDPQSPREVAALLRWLTDEHFTFLGYRRFATEPSGDRAILHAVEDSDLGLVSRVADDPSAPAGVSIRPVGQVSDGRLPLVVMTKSSSLSPVHRRVHMDVVAIRILDAEGRSIGEHRFLGLLTHSAMRASVHETPLIRVKATAVRQALDVVEGSHTDRDLDQFLETLPRDELFQSSGHHLREVAAGVLQLQGRRRTRIFIRIDDDQRYVVALVYLPRDRYTTVVRQRIEALLRSSFGGESSDFSASVTESPIARLHYVVRMERGRSPIAVNLSQLEGAVGAITRSWSDDFLAVLADSEAADPAAAELEGFARTYPESYKEAYSPEVGVRDARVIASLDEGDLDLDLHEAPEGEAIGLRFKVIRVGDAMSLSRVLPMLQHLGVDVLEELPCEIDLPDGRVARVFDFGLGPLPADVPDAQTLPARFTEAFRAAWLGHLESDRLNSLIVRAGLTWPQVALLRAYAHHLRQGSLPYSLDYIDQALTENPAAARLLIELATARLAPGDSAERGEESASRVRSRFAGELDAVASLDQDRILRALEASIGATLRTNAFADRGVDSHAALAFKFDAKSLGHLPQPRPRYEIWVYSPRVEGVHLRFGRVARGGLRWSDRPEDFRTEVLGLVKAQEVKNAIIVPVGAKGGFVPKQLPDPMVDRDAWLEEGRGAYCDFIRALLSVTDNLVNGEVVPPSGVRRLDGDDPYLVVAADKGTATFSDLANGIAVERGFWLGDAFASGGSQGYDHKAMGITAKGAWESVMRHFREVGINTQEQEFTVVGIGDMSGDVFGNGMLLSPHIRLIAAFDHRDIFIDPSPDPVASLAERQRLFALPRSSWQDYDRERISAGGGVFSRSAKSITLSDQACGILDLNAGEPATPQEVIQAILRSRVDLLWNGGIGTYVRARSESNAEVGDKSNDAIRITGGELRCRVVGEGGNLGFTQRGRIEAAHSGVRLNTDAIDNSAGVDTSDHEVNLKILLDGIVAEGALSVPQRNDFLRELTDDVAELVLLDNYRQNLTLGNARAQAAPLLSVHQRLIQFLEDQGVLDRALEFLPDDDQLTALAAEGRGLTGPELAVLLAYSKIWLTAELNASRIVDEPYFASVVNRYFPPQCAQRFPDAIARHPLRKEIVSTVTCNDLINLGGISFVFRVIEEYGATSVEVVRAAMAAIEVFGIARLRSRINDLDNLVPTSTQIKMHLELRRLLDRSTRWFLTSRGGDLDVATTIADYRSTVQDHAGLVVSSMRGQEAERLRHTTEDFEAGGAPAAMAAEVAALLDVFSLLDIHDLCRRIGESPTTIVPLYFAFSEHVGIDRLLLLITSLPREDHWTAQARQALRGDLYGIAVALVESIASATPSHEAPEQRIAAWESQRSASMGRARATLAEVFQQDPISLATLSVALRVLRTVAAS